MGIKLQIISVFVLILMGICDAQTEDQRKYGINDYAEFEEFILSSAGTQSLSTHFHSTYTYYDLYLDTPDFLLKQNKLSLRFRKRITGQKKRPVTYSMQLKSEMDSLSSVRMEVDEPELDFYKLKMAGEWHPLTELLDSIFAYVDRGPTFPLDEDIKSVIEVIQAWIAFKANGAIAPFQKLQFLGIDESAIQAIVPITGGKTTRYRSHIYADSIQNLSLKLIKNRVSKSALPKHFKKNRSYNWIMESSLDQAMFYSLIPSTIDSVRIVEYEVENKHHLPSRGAVMMDMYERELREEFGLSMKKDSKYKQALILFEQK